MDPVRLNLTHLGSDVKTSLGIKPVHAGADEKVTTPFSEVLKQSFMKVNDMQVQADDMVKRLALGEVNDISEVSVTAAKAELALRTMVEIRNKLVEAYQQIARMPV